MNQSGLQILVNGGRRVPTPSAARKPETRQVYEVGGLSSLQEENFQSAEYFQRAAPLQSAPGAENVPPLSAGKENKDQALLGKRKLAEKETGYAADLVETLRHCEPGGSDQLFALTALRKVLTSRSNPPIQEVLNSGGEGILADVLSRRTGISALMKLEAAWSLVQLASGSSAQTKQLVEAGVAAAALEALTSPKLVESSELCERCLELLANVAGDSDSSLRDHLLESGIVNVLGGLFAQMPSYPWGDAARDAVLRCFTWLMSTLCRGTPPPELEQVDCAFDFFSQVVQGTADVEMLSSAIWGLCYLLEGATEDANGCARAERLLLAGFQPDEVPKPPHAHPLLKQVVGCMRVAGDRRSPLPAAALRLTGQLVSLPQPALTDAAIAAGALKALHAQLVDTYAPAQLQRDAAWVLANIAAGTAEQAKRLSEAPGLMEALAERAERSSSPKVRRECAWAIMNLCKRSPEMLLRLDARTVLRTSIIALRGESDPALQLAVLDAVEMAVRRGRVPESSSSLAVLAKEIGLADELLGLRKSQEIAVQEKAHSVLVAVSGVPGSAAALEAAEAPSMAGEGGKAKAKGEDEPANDGVNSPRRRAKYKFGA